jgi:hypothetical protein
MVRISTFALLASPGYLPAETCPNRFWFFRERLPNFVRHLVYLKEKYCAFDDSVALWVVPCKSTKRGLPILIQPLRFCRRWVISYRT